MNLISFQTIILIKIERNKEEEKKTSKKQVKLRPYWDLN